LTAAEQKISLESGKQLITLTSAKKDRGCMFRFEPCPAHKIQINSENLKLTAKILLFLTKKFFFAIPIYITSSKGTIIRYSIP
jgi:hypothetical protein